LTPDRTVPHAWVPQIGLADCGLAALAMVGHRLGVKLSVQDLWAETPPGPEGLSLRQLQKLAAAHGLECQGARVPLERLSQVPLPAVAHLSDGHYIVLHELCDAGVVVGDPATGVTTWSVESLARCASGALLVFDSPFHEGACHGVGPVRPEETHSDVRFPDV
jgi:ABC-type bacteriocin/lantibiotic exporter with double-glycine peptidase domain